jgi:hypothetical protein
MFQSINYKVIKSIGNNKFEVSLLESPDGTFLIHKTTYMTDTYGERIVDIGTALFAFETTVVEMEGN